MLRALRSGGIVQVLMVGVVGAIIAVFVLEFRAAGGNEVGSLTRSCVVKVEECLDVKDFYAAYNLIVPRGMPAKTVRTLKLREQVLEGLVEREMLLAEAERIGVGISPEAVDDELALGRAHVSLPAEDALRLGFSLDLSSADAAGFSRDMVRELPVENPKTQKFDPEIYKRTVRNWVRRSPKEFKLMQERELIAARMRDLVRARVRLSDAEAFDAFVRDRSRAVVRLAKLNREWFARYVADVSDEAADAWASAHKKELDEAYAAAKDQWKSGCTLFSEIRIDAPPDLSDDEKALDRARLEEAKKRLTAGASFAATARAVSEGPSAATGGFVGCLDEKELGNAHEPVKAALESLEPGKVSDIIETERGFYLVRDEGKLGEDAEARVRRALARRQAVEEAADRLAKEYGQELLSAVKAGESLEDAVRVLNARFAEKWSDGARRGPDDADESAPLADERRPKIEISAPFSAAMNPLPTAMPAVSPAQIAFELEKEDAVHPELIPTFEGHAVMQLKEKTTATREEFEKDKSEVMQQLLLAKRNDALVRYMEQLRERYKTKVETNPAMVEDKSEGEDAEG